MGMLVTAWSLELVGLGSNLNSSITHPLCHCREPLVTQFVQL